LQNKYKQLGTYTLGSTLLEELLEALGLDLGLGLGLGGTYTHSTLWQLSLDADFAQKQDNQDINFTLSRGTKFKRSCNCRRSDSLLDAQDAQKATPHKAEAKRSWRICGILATLM
jgi:hypothetical protein